jgi:hypothetical protein
LWRKTSKQNTSILVKTMNNKIYEEEVFLHNLHIISYIGFRQVIQTSSYNLSVFYISWAEGEGNIQLRQVIWARITYEDCEEKLLNKITSILVKTMNNKICHTAIENLSDPIGYLLDFTNPYYTALAGNMKAVSRKIPRIYL